MCVSTEHLHHHRRRLKATYTPLKSTFWFESPVLKRSRRSAKELLKEKVGEGLAEREGRGTEVGLGFRDAGCRLGEVGACLLLYSY